MGDFKGFTVVISIVAILFMFSILIAKAIVKRRKSRNKSMIIVIPIYLWSIIIFTLATCVYMYLL